MMERYWVAVAAPAAITLLLWRTSPHQPTETSVLIVFLLLLLPWFSYAHWKNNADDSSCLPLFAAIALMHWVYFGLPLFWGSRRVESRFASFVSEQAVERVLLMVLLGIVCLWVGLRLVPRTRLRPPRYDLPDVASVRRYLHGFVIAGSLINGTGALNYALGESGRQLIIVLTTLVPFTALAVLLREQLAGRGCQADRIVIALALGSRAVLGVASGWAGSLAVLAILSMAVYVKERRRLPVSVIVVAVCALLFLQAGKTEFRVNYWYGQAQGGPIDRIEYWLGTSWNRWAQALDEPSGEGVTRLLENTLMRVSLLEQAANVLELTPSMVEFQRGATYSYLAVTFIPRFLWPDKPSVNEANHFYQLNYGFSTLADLDRVSIAVGFLTEGYINFGYPGVAGVMFVVGVLLGLFDLWFLHYAAGTFWMALGVALLTPLLTIESQMAQYLGGVLQQIVLAVLAFVPVLRRLPREAEGAETWREAVPA